MKQRTIAESVKYEGMGLHTGKSSTLTLSPLPEDSGICFAMGTSAKSFRVDPYRVCDTTRCTTLAGDSGEKIKTVEHLLAAIAMCQVDNIMVGLSDGEVPLGDGSSKTFIDMINGAGIIELMREQPVIAINRTLTVTNIDRMVIALPYDGFRVTCLFNDNHGSLGMQAYDGISGINDFCVEIGQARTIGFLKEIESLQAQGLALGGVLDNAIVIDDNGYYNNARYSDEPVRHKALDLLGDMACLGRLQAHLISIKGGHAMNNELARQIYQSL